MKTTPRPDPVPVEADLPEKQLHPAARQAPVPVCPDCQPRARRILHALAFAAQHHGFTIAAATDNSGASEEITARETTFTLHFAESRSEHYDPTASNTPGSA